MSIGGVGSGQSDYIQQLLFIESQPLRDLQSRRSDLDVRLGILSDLRTKVNAFKSQIQGFAQLGSASLLRRFEVTSSDETVLTATAGSTATVGGHTVTVSSLAQAHSIASDAFTGTGTDIAAGSYEFDITVAGQTTTVRVDIEAGDDNATAMQKVVDAIRDVSDGVSANLVTTNTTTDTRAVVVTSVNTGTVNLIAEVTDRTGNLAAVLGLAGSSSVGGYSANTRLEAKDAEFLLDGVQITSDSNEVDGVLSGVVLSLKSTSDVPVSLQVIYDREALKEKITAMFDAFNEVVDFLNGKLASGDETGSGRGALAGELTFFTFRGQLVQSVARSITDAFALDGVNSLDDVGLSLSREGKLTLGDEEAFFGALTGNPDAVEAFFGSGDGIATRLHDVVKSFTKVGGALDLSRNLVESKKDVLDLRIERMESSLSVREEQLRDQMGRLSLFVAQIGAQQAAFQSLMTSSSGLFGY